MRKNLSVIALMLIFILSAIIVLNFILPINKKNDDNDPIKDEPVIETNEPKQDEPQPETPEQKPEEPEPEPEKKKSWILKAAEDGRIIYSSPDSGAYRYGPSIMKYPDGTMDAWFSSPGNNSTEWDWITYRHFDGESWSAEKVVLRPTPGSYDSCSCCDPGVVYFDGWYYLAYTSTNDSARKGANNSAFVARSQYPDGPFEKWNGQSWGGSPEPIIRYEGDPDGWGIGEVSFVIYDDDLCLFYTYFDTQGGSTCLAKANLVEDWPLTMREKGTVCQRENQDSLDVVYCDDEQTFLAFSIEYRMSDSSRLIMYESGDGKDFHDVEETSTGIREYAHNLGISKNPDGHISTQDDLLVGYAYGRTWGRWSVIFQDLTVRYK